MDSQNGKSKTINKAFAQSRMERIHKMSLKDVPLEARRKEARKPLFLARYE